MSLLATDAPPRRTKPFRPITSWRFLLLIALAASSAVSAWAQLDRSDTAPLTAPGVGAFGFGKPEHSITKLAPGVDWIQDIIPASDPNGPLIVDVITISPHAARGRLHVALGEKPANGNTRVQGRQPVSAIAARNHSLLAINGSFFTYTGGQPLGLCVVDGTLVSEPLLGRTAFCIDGKGRATIAAFTGSGQLIAQDGASHPLSGFNRLAGKTDDLLLYTPGIFVATPKVKSRTEATAEIPATLEFNKLLTGDVTRITSGPGGTAVLPHSVVMSGGARAAAFLREHVSVGTACTIRYDTNPLLDGIRDAIAGGPRLCDKGQIVIGDEGFAPSFVTSRNPRTAVGVREDGTILLLTVDGRQPLLSRGATLPETAALLLKYGAVRGVNFDGGGSTALAVRGGVVNAPSDGAERAVADALVLEDAHPGNNDSLADIPFVPRDNGPIAVGTVRTFGLAEGVSTSNGEGVVWSVRGDVGFVSQQGHFLGLRPGTGSIVAALRDGRRFSTPIAVVAANPVGAQAPGEATTPVRTEEDAPRP